MKPNTMSRDPRAGFSLVELLVVIGIITVLIGILLPVISWARSAANSTRCLSNLRQLADSFHMYVGSHQGRSILWPNGNDPKAQEWWDILKGVRGVMLCPEAVAVPPGPTPRNLHYRHGSAHECWELDPNGFHGMVLGSYGFNGCLFDSASPAAAQQHGLFQPSAGGSDRIPLFGDCVEFYDSNPAKFAMDRHGTAVNIVFLDGHAECVPVTDLWKLRWSATYQSRNVGIPAH